MMNSHHTPVLFNESLEYLITDKSGIYFDGTLGFGGHSEGILLNVNKDARLIATDVDTDAFNFSKEKSIEDKTLSLDLAKKWFGVILSCCKEIQKEKE